MIWGIGAKQIDKVDAACARALVPSPDELRTRLIELHHLATDPPISGVKIEAVTVPTDGGRASSFALSHKGHSPYRAEFNIKNYYMHASDGSIIPSPVILRRLFYPQSLAKLEMRVILSSSRKERDGVPTDLWRYRAFLKNAGRATAREVLPRQESFASLHILPMNSRRRNT